MPRLIESAVCLMRKALAFIRRDALLQACYQFAAVMNLISIMFGVAAYYFLSKLYSEANFKEFRVFGNGYFSFILIGVACYSYMNVAIGTFANNIRQMQTTGTLEAMMLTHTRLTTIVLLSNLWAFFSTLSQLLIYFLVGWLFFDFDLARVNISSTVILLAAIAISFSPFGVLSASFTLAFKRGDPIYFIISAVSALLGGVYYPISVLPEIMQHLSQFLPITVALNGLRKTIGMGYSELQVMPELIQLGSLTLFLGPLALVSFLWAIRRAKINGTLSQF